MMMWPFPDDGSFHHAHSRLPQTDDSDVHLTYQVADRFLADNRLRHQAITIEVQNRVALLSGTVDSEEVTQAAGATARATKGIFDVCNALQVSRSDDRSAARALPTQERAGREPVCELSTPDDRRRFEEIVAGLTTGGLSSAQRPVAAPRRRTPVVLPLLVAITGALLLVLMAALGWIGALIACAVCAVIVEMVYSPRSRRTRGPRPHGLEI